MATDEVKKIAVIMPKWVGDCVMATPALRALRQRHPKATIIAISKNVIASLLQPTGLVDQWVTYRGNKNLFAQARRLRTDSIDATISFPSSLSTGIATWLTGAPRRIGYRRDGRSIFLNDSTAYRQKDDSGQIINEIDRFLQLTARIGCDTQDRRTELCVANEDRLLCNRMLESLQISHVPQLVVLNSSAAVQPAKRLTDDFMIGLCQQMTHDNQTAILLHCGPGERKENAELAKRIDHPHVKSMGDFDELPIGLSLAVMERADAVVSTDSGPRHMAAALDRPLVSIFGPTDPMKTRLFNRPETIIQTELACRPCWKTHCPLGHHQCMKQLSYQTVASKVQRHLQHDGSNTSAA